MKTALTTVAALVLVASGAAILDTYRQSRREQRLNDEALRAAKAAVNPRHPSVLYGHWAAGIDWEDGA